MGSWVQLGLEVPVGVTLRVDDLGRALGVLFVPDKTNGLVDLLAQSFGNLEQLLDDFHSISPLDG